MLVFNPINAKQFHTISLFPHSGRAFLFSSRKRFENDFN